MLTVQKQQEAVHSVDHTIFVRDLSKMSVATIDMEQALVTAGLKPAGAKLTTEVLGIVNPCLEGLEASVAALKLDCFARVFAEAAKGEDCLDGLPSEFPLEFTPLLLAAAYKAFAPSEREAKTAQCILDGSAFFNSRRQLSRSLARADSSPVVPDGTDRFPIAAVSHPRERLPSGVSAAVTDPNTVPDESIRTTASTPIQRPSGLRSPAPTPTIDGAVGTGAIAAEAGRDRASVTPLPPVGAVIEARDRASVNPLPPPGMVIDVEDMVRRVTAASVEAITVMRRNNKARKKCESCGKTKAYCLCAHLDAPPPPKRGETGAGLQTIPPPRVPMFGAPQYSQFPIPVQHTVATHTQLQRPVAVPRDQTSAKSHKHSSSDSSESSSSDDTSYHSSTAPATRRVPSDTRFQNPAVLFETDLWNNAFQDGQTIEDLRRELITQMGIARLRRDQPNAWTTDLGEQIVEITLLATEESASPALLFRLFQILFRLRLFSHGASPEDIALAMAKLRGYRLPKQFRAAAAKCDSKKAEARRPPYVPPASAAAPGSGRVSPAVWKTMSAAQKAAHKRQFPRG